MKGKSVLAVLTLLGTTACAVGPGYRPATPSVLLPGGFTSYAAGISSAEPTSTAWWGLYNDPAIDALVTEALAANPDVRVAVANLLTAQALREEVAAGRLPATTATSDLNYGRNQRFVPNAAGDRLTWQAGFAVSYELDLFRRVARSIEVADAEVGAAQSDVAATRVLIAAGVLDSYASACALAAAIKAQQDSVVIADRQAELSALLQQAGSVGTLEVERSAALAAAARADLAPIERERRAALLSLAILLGRSPSNIPQSAERCRKSPTISAAIPVGDGATLLRRRPDVARAERLLAAETGRIGIATADLYPTIRFGGSLSQLGGVGPSSGLIFGVGPLLSVNIPNQSAGRARVREAEGRAEAALARFDGTVLAALREVEQAIDGYGAEQRRNAALVDAERRADRAYGIANALVRAGAIGQLDLLVAQRSLTEAKVQKARSDEAMTRAQIALFKALGEGWPEAASSEPYLKNSEDKHAQ